VEFEWFDRFCIAEQVIAYRYFIALITVSFLAQAFAQSPRVVAPAASAIRPAWVAVPRSEGRIRAAQIGLVINTADPYSVAVGEHYIERRGLKPAQVLRVELPTRPTLNVDEFNALRQAIGEHFGAGIQALALAWVTPFAVECNSITGALALGFDGELCKHPCGPSRPSPYFDSASARPMSDLGLRPSMLLAAGSVEQARALIDRGVASDGTLRLRARLPVTAMFLTTGDAARRVRTVLYPPPGLQRSVGIDVRVAPAESLKDAPRVLLAITGSRKLDLPPGIDWVPGALADHLTSVGGALAGGHDQSTVLEWIASGATASYGTVSEPCNHLQKFPHPQLLLLNYVQGASAIEAYWKSVAWPQQGLFVGEPLAAPFGRR
jgi:uncharacterized protein (TIGR03790 family)